MTQTKKMTLRMYPHQKDALLKVTKRFNVTQNEAAIMGVYALNVLASYNSVDEARLAVLNADEKAERSYTRKSKA